jgi:hypothetical protein
MHLTDHHSFASPFSLRPCWFLPAALAWDIWQHSDSTLSAAGLLMTLSKCTKKVWRTYKLMVMTPLKFVELCFVCATSQQLLPHVRAVFGEALYP